MSQSGRHSVMAPPSLLESFPSRETSRDVTSVSCVTARSAAAAAQSALLTADAVSSSLSCSLPFIHGPLDTGQVAEFMVGFRCILVLLTVALSDDSVCLEEGRCFWGSGLRSTPFYFSQVRLKRCYSFLSIDCYFYGEQNHFKVTF